MIFAPPKCLSVEFDVEWKTVKAHENWDLLYDSMVFIMIFHMRVPHKMPYFGACEIDKKRVMIFHMIQVFDSG